MALPIRFGLFLGQVNRDWPELLEQFLMAEELGFDHAFLVDHFMNTGGPPDDGCMEAWTLLAALAARTSRVRLGVLVSSVTYRHPSLLVKEAVTVDRISGGRLILGLGTGWYEEEHRRYGFAFPPARERVERLEEAVTIADLLMRGRRTTFRGRHYRLEDAPLEPRPVQRPRIPILIGAHRPRALRLAARHADMWDTYPTTAGSATAGTREEVGERVERFERYCREAGRDPGEVRRSTWTGGAAIASEGAFLTFFETYRSIGFTDFITGLPGREHLPAVRRIAAGLIPELRGAAGKGVVI